MTNSKQRSSSREYDGVDVDVDVDEDAYSTELDVDNVEEMDVFEDDSPSTGDIPLGDCSSLSCSNRRTIRCFSPILLVLTIVAFLSLAWPLVNNNRPEGLDTHSSSSNTSAEVLPRSASSFFEHELEWKEVPPSSTRNSEGLNENSPTSNQCKASIEFCSDPSKNLYGYGPVGNCVPGRPAPLIRMQPKRFYQLTLYNNAHIDTNLHTHGLHVSGVGTADDVTRVAKPGECLVYDVSLWAIVALTFALKRMQRSLLTFNSIPNLFDIVFVSLLTIALYP